MCGIYCIENLLNGKKYIGQSIDIDTRIKNHKRALNSATNTHPNQHLQKAWDKYGSENFDFYILEECEADDLDDKEKYWSEFYDVYNTEKGYAMKTAGQGSGSRIISEDAKRKISEGNKGKVISEYARRRLSEANRGKIVSVETREKMSRASKGRVPSELSLQKAAEWHSVEIVQLTKDGKYVNRYSSAADAERQTGINANTIRRCCNKLDNCKSAGGFMWINSDEYDTLDSNKLCYQNNSIKPIIQLDMLGNYVAEFNSCVEAALSIKSIKKAKGINACCCGKTKSAYGFIWVYKCCYDVNKDYTYKKGPYHNQYSVMQLDQQGNLISEFDSVQDAHIATGINYCCICDCCKGRQNTAGGYIWVKNT